MILDFDGIVLPNGRAIASNPAQAALERQKPEVTPSADSVWKSVNDTNPPLYRCTIPGQGSLTSALPGDVVDAHLALPGETQPDKNHYYIVRVSSAENPVQIIHIPDGQRPYAAEGEITKPVSLSPDGEYIHYMGERTQYFREDDSIFYSSAEWRINRHTLTQEPVDPNTTISPFMRGLMDKQTHFREKLDLDPSCMHSLNPITKEDAARAFTSLCASIPSSVFAVLGQVGAQYIIHETPAGNGVKGTHEMHFARTAFTPSTPQYCDQLRQIGAGYRKAMSALDPSATRKLDGVLEDALAKVGVPRGTEQMEQEKESTFAFIFREWGSPNNRLALKDRIGPELYQAFEAFIDRASEFSVGPSA